MKSHDQSGFSNAIIIVAILIVAAIGLVGWRVSRKNPEPVVTTTVETPSNSKAQTDNSQTSGATKYLEIKEWGVKFALTADTSDAYYDNKTSSPLDSMSLRAHSLDSEPDCTNGPQSVATLFRVPKDALDEMANNKKYSQVENGKVIDNYFFFISGSQYSCTDNTDKQIVLQGVRNSFNTAGPTIQKIN